MSDVLVSAYLPFVGGEAGDGVTNTFVFHKEGAYVPGEATAIFARLVAFYGAVAPPATQPISHFLSTAISRQANVCELQAYDITNHLDGSPHGSPIAVGNFGIGPAGVDANLAPQVAAVLTLRGRNAWNYPVEAPDAGDDDSQVDRPRQRRTGRLYLGPFNTGAAGTNSQKPAHIDGAFRVTAVHSAEALQDTVNALGYGWAVWSRKNEATSIIERVEIDSSWDTMRSRKARPEVRETLTFVPTPPLALGA